MNDFIWDHPIIFTIIVGIILLAILGWAIDASEKNFMNACTATGRTEVECKYEYLKSQNDTTYIPVVIPIR